jgi:hypothetical protein
MRRRFQVWWDDAFVKFDEITLSSSLMRWRFRQSWWDDVFFRQDWWVALVKIDESSHFDKMLCQAWRLIIKVARKVGNEHTSFDKSRTDIRHSIIRMSMRHSLKVRLDNQKKLTMRRSSMITRINRSNNLCKEQIWIAFLRSHFIFRDKTQNTLLVYFRSEQSQYSLQQVNFHQRKFINSYSSQQ